MECEQRVGYDVSPEAQGFARARSPPVITACSAHNTPCGSTYRVEETKAYLQLRRP
jgi:hypothetical protein